MTNIKVINLQKKLNLKVPAIKAVVKTVLKNLNVKQSELSIVFVSYQKIRALNIQYLKRHHTTDVLAFDLRDADQMKRSHIMGDVFISADAATKQSKEFNTNPAYELTLYVVHGILHLQGYDDHIKEDILKMRKKEAALMKILGRKVNGVTG